MARLLRGLTLAAAALAASQTGMLYQCGQFWIRRFRTQAPALGVALTPLAVPTPEPDFVARAIGMLPSIGWIAARRFLFSELRAHLLGWRIFSLHRGGAPRWPQRASPPEDPHTAFAWRRHGLLL